MLIECDRYELVQTLGRRPLDYTHDRLTHHQLSMLELAGRAPLKAVDDAFCCLGTTMKSAGSRAEFERVDYHMVVDFARLALDSGARRFFLVSAQAADEDSLFYYSRIKGRAERAVSALGFDTLHILRPSLLLGHREEFRFGERAGQALMRFANPILCGRLRPFRAIRAEEVAEAMLSLSASQCRGTSVHSLPLGT